MTVKDLRDELSQYNDDMEVVMKPSNSMYVDEIGGARVKELRAFYGEDRDVLVLISNGQEGAV